MLPYLLDLLRTEEAREGIRYGEVVHQPSSDRILFPVEITRVEQNYGNYSWETGTF